MERNDFIADAFISIRKDKFFDKSCSGKIILSVNAYEYCDRNDMIQFFCKFKRKSNMTYCTHYGVLQ